LIVITLSKERVFLICKHRKRVTEKGNNIRERKR
jgi:hypothetical protein